MKHSPEGSNPVAEAGALERPLRAVEEQLSALGLALHRQDATAIDSAAAELHVALARAVDHFALAARQGALPAPLRQRLARAGGQVAAQREALARATASLDRAIDVLMPPLAAGSLYAATGASRRPGSGGVLLA